MIAGSDSQFAYISGFLWIVCMHVYLCFLFVLLQLILICNYECSLDIRFVPLRDILHLLCHQIFTLIKMILSALVMLMVRYDIGALTMAVVLESQRQNFSICIMHLFTWLCIEFTFQFAKLKIFLTDQGGTAQMRFQPRLGRYLAAAAENVVSILDVETQACRYSLKVSLNIFF